MNEADSYWGRDELMAIAAIRYCLGRRTYIVRDCVEWILANWQRFSSYTQLIIQRDVEEIFARDDSVRNDYKDWIRNVKDQDGQTKEADWTPLYPLGDDCDRTEWEKVRALWKDGPASFV